MDQRRSESSVWKRKRGGRRRLALRPAVTPFSKRGSCSFKERATPRSLSPKRDVLSPGGRRGGEWSEKKAWCRSRITWPTGKKSNRKKKVSRGGDVLVQKGRETGRRGPLPSLMGEEEGEGLWIPHSGFFEGGKKRKGEGESW